MMPLLPIKNAKLLFYWELVLLVSVGSVLSMGKCPQGSRYHRHNDTSGEGSSFFGVNSPYTTTRYSPYTLPVRSRSEFSERSNYRPTVQALGLGYPAWRRTQYASRYSTQGSQGSSYNAAGIPNLLPHRYAPNTYESSCSSSVRGRSTAGVTGSSTSSRSPCRRCREPGTRITSTTVETGPGSRQSRQYTPHTSVQMVGMTETEQYGRVSKCDQSKNQQTIYSQEFTAGNGKTRKFQNKRYRGKVLLIVVMATFHPLAHQLVPLNSLQEKYDGVLKILAFPSNQFRITENGANHSEIMNILYYVRPGSMFTPSFELHGLTSVNGATELPLFSYLKAACPPTRAGYMEPPTDLKYDPVRNYDVREPYEKFLVNGKGMPVARYDARVGPLEIEQDLVEELRKLDEEDMEID